MSNIGSYEEKYRNFDWKEAEKELGFAPGNPINIGWYCSDRICDMGKARQDRPHLGRAGRSRENASLTTTSAGLRTRSAHFLRGLGINAGDRVCLFMDRVPELYIGVLGILKIGAIGQPLFSAFGDESLFVRLENAETTAVITQRKHAPKVRKILDKLPHLKHIIIVDHDGKAPCREREIAFSLEKAEPGRTVSRSTRPRPNPRRSSTTLRERPASPRASSTSIIRSSPST